MGLSGINEEIQSGSPTIDPEISSFTIISQIESSLHNSEVAAIALRYLKDERRSDIQRLLRNPDTRHLVIDQLKNIADRAYRSLISSLIEGPDKIHAINGLQAKVDALGDEMIEQNSPLFVEHRYKISTDKDYRKAELDYREARKSSGDSRWLAWDPTLAEHRLDASLILSEAASRQKEVEDFLTEVQLKAALPEGSVISSSQRVKNIDSLFNKIAKFRSASWGKESTIADAVDLLGARIVVSDLKSLEAIMQSVESLLEIRPELVVLRKENKFVVNHKKADPYRAIHYIITLPSENGQMHSFELQLTTFPAVLSGDLAHDAIYKPHLLNLPSELQQVVRDYNWESNERELVSYLGKKVEVVAELSREQRIEKAISEMDYNVFYDLVLRHIDLRRPLDEKTKEYLSRFHKKEVEKLEMLQGSDEKTVVELAQAAHNSYFRKNARQFYNLTSDELGSSLPQEAVEYLTPQAQARYGQRYEVFNGRNNKLSVEDLELHKLSDEQLEQFFTAAYKDISVEGTKLRALIEKIKSARGEDERSMLSLRGLFVMNLNHAPFETLFALTEEGNPDVIKNPEARKMFRETLIASQMKAVATASLLTEIGGLDEDGLYQDLSKEALPGTGYSIREMLTHMFFITVNRTSSETAGMSFEEFATSLKTTWARDNDKVVDRGILTKLVTKQLAAIEKAVDKEENPILLARLEKARFELVGKFLRIMAADRSVAERLVNYINTRSREEVRVLLDNDMDSKRLIGRIKSPAYFNALTNYLISEAEIPDIFT